MSEKTAAAAGERSSFVPPEMVSPMQASESVAMKTVMKRHLANTSPIREEKGNNDGNNRVDTSIGTPMSSGGGSPAAAAAAAAASPSRVYAPVAQIGSNLAAAFQLMKNGSLMLKLCRTGPPHMRHFYINASKTTLRWKSQKKSPAKTEVSVGDMLKIEEGQLSDAFKKNSKYLADKDNALSFSIYYYVKNKTEIRTLDIICKDDNEYEKWVEGIKYLIENKEQLLDQFLHEKWKDDEHSKNDVLYGSFDVYTMGSSTCGQLAHAEYAEDLVDLDIPTRVRYFIDQHVTNICTIDVGDDHMVAATTSGDVYAWGNAGCNRLGQVERRDTVFYNFLLPKHINFFRNPDLEVTHVACGACHTLFLTSTGTVYAAGSNAMGQLGIGQKIESAHVVKVLVPNPVNYIAAGNMTSAAISSSSIACLHRTVTEAEYAKMGVENYQRLLYTWGCNLWGATGQGLEPKACFSPTEVLNAGRVSNIKNSYRSHYSCLSVSFGDFHAAAIVECIGGVTEEEALKTVNDPDSSHIEKIGHRYLMTWGSNVQGQLGHNTDMKDKKDSKHNDNHEDKRKLSPYPQIVRFFNDNFFKPSLVSCGAAHTSLLSLHIGDVNYDHSSVNDNYSEMCFHTWGLAGACCFLGETSISNVIATPKRIEKTEFYQNIGESKQPVQRRSSVVGDLLKSVGSRKGSMSEGEVSGDEGRAGEWSETEAASDVFKSIACGSLFTYVLMYSGHTFLLGQPLPFSEKAVPKYVNKNIESIAAGGGNIAFIARRKWVADHEVDACTNCNAEFTTFRRRHHCRNCGGLFCNDCSSKRAIIEKYGFDSEVRVCDACYTAVKSAAADQQR